jgi:hypothetical protein
MLPEAKSEMKFTLTLSLPKPREGAEVIFKTYEVFTDGEIRCCYIINAFCRCGGKKTATL